MRKIRHGKLPITLESSDELDFEMLKTISLNMEYTGWEYWVDEYGEWFNPYKPNPNQLELFV
tara:strand:+ start:467 stop:652 length:186 start_codon:yes stop_codon:yes gene_type:complete